EFDIFVRLNDAGDCCGNSAMRLKRIFVGGRVQYELRCPLNVAVGACLHVLSPCLAFFCLERHCFRVATPFSHIFRRYSPPTSYNAWLICPSELYFTASTNCSNTFFRSRAVSCKRFRLSGASEFRASP